MSCVIVRSLILCILVIFYFHLSPQATAADGEFKNSDERRSGCSSSMGAGGSLPGNAEATEGDYFALSLTGGGVRNITQILMLLHIEHLTGRRIHEIFKVVAGTSAGGMLAVYIAATTGSDGSAMYTLEQIARQYTRNIRRAFSPSVRHSARNLCGLLGPRHENTVLVETFRGVFGKSRLSQTNVELFVPVVNDGSKRLTCLSTGAARENPKGEDFLLGELAAGIVAFTGFYAPVEMKNIGGQASRFFDAGAHAYDPTSLVLEGLQGEGRKASEIKVLRLGSGVPWLNPVSDKGLRNKNGFKSLQQTLLMLVHGLNVQSETGAKLFFGDQVAERYFHLEFPVPGDVFAAIDATDSRSIDRLIEAVTNYMRTSEYRRKIEGFFGDKLKANAFDDLEAFLATLPDIVLSEEDRRPTFCEQSARFLQACGSGLYTCGSVIYRGFTACGRKTRIGYQRLAQGPAEGLVGEKED